MAKAGEFQHLQLLRTKVGRARLVGGGEGDPRTTANRQNRRGHSGHLTDGVTNFLNYWNSYELYRSNAKLPEIKSGIPMLLKVDESLDIDGLRHYLKFEIISEEENGYVIVASEDINLAVFKSKIGEFSQGITGSAIIAQIHEIVEENAVDNRLKRILNDKIREDWDNIVNLGDFVIDVSISCSGNWDVPKKPTRGKNVRLETFERKMAEWNKIFIKAYMDWDDLREKRKAEIFQILNAYGANLIDEFEPGADETIPDNFTMRIGLNGTALKDFVATYPYLFQVEEPEDIETPQGVRRKEETSEPNIRFAKPLDGAPSICVIDSGIQEDHIWIEPGLYKPGSYCFVPKESTTDTADYVRNGGHGTRVAGAILYGEQVPKTGKAQIALWIQNARVLDKSCHLPKNILPEKLINQVINHYIKNDKPVKIFNHSINSSTAFSRIHMTAWAYEIDRLSFGHDVLIIQSTGNLFEVGTANNPGVRDFLTSGQVYPTYLSQKSCRIANPAQSLQALSVGSVSYDAFNSGGWQTFSGGIAMPSSFSRSGPGIWDSIKPDVVEETVGTVPLVAYPLIVFLAIL